MRDRAHVSRPFPTPLPVGLFHFEALEAGSPAGDGAPAGPVADAPAPAEPPAEPAAQPAPETPWSPPREEWERTQFRLEQLADTLLAPEPNEDLEYPGDRFGDPEAGQLELDPLDENFGQNLVALMQQTVQEAVAQATGPFLQDRQAQAFQEADQRALDILDSFKQQPGAQEFDSNIARELARQFMAEEAQRWGGLNPRAAESALGKAARMLVDHDRQVAEQAVNKYRAELEGVGGARPGALPGATGVVTQPDARDEMDLARKLAQQARV